MSMFRAEIGIAPHTPQDLTVLRGRFFASMTLYGITNVLILFRSGPILAPVLDLLVRFHRWRIGFRYLLRTKVVCMLHL